MEQTISDIVKRAKDIDAAEALAELNAMVDEYNKAQEIVKDQQERFWNSFSKQHQLDLFCAVVRRIHKAEIQDKGSYRYALYSIFGFDESSYALALEAGYMDIHNRLFRDDDWK